MERSWRGWLGRVTLVGLAGLALANGGCLFLAAGAAAGGGAATYAYCKGKVCRTYNATLDDTWSAAHAALADLAMPVEGEERVAAKGHMRSRLADGSRVRITFEVEQSPIPAEGRLTCVGIRIATFGDQEISRRILDQIDAHLTHPNVLVGPPAPPGPPPVWAPTSRPLETAPPPVLAPEPQPKK